MQINDNSGKKVMTVHEVRNITTQDRNTAGLPVSRCPYSGTGNAARYRSSCFWLISFGALIAHTRSGGPAVQRRRVAHRGSL